MIKKVLILGGSHAQIPVILEAKKQNLYVITCDYLPDNPGHKLADEYYNISTTDVDAVLALAEKVKPDFIIAYASDPAAPVAAYVSDQLSLPGNTFHAVQVLSEKDQFRNFLSKNGFTVPRAIAIAGDDFHEELFSEMQFPLIVKPTDSSGSKGVSKIDNFGQFLEAAKLAMAQSRKKRIIVEEFIDTNGEQIHGDGYVVDGQLVFSYLGDHHYNSAVNPFVPYSTTWPSKVGDKYIDAVNAEVQRVLSMLDFQNGGINIEARIHKGKVYLMEIGPRNGGNYVPQVLAYLTGFNMVKALVDSLLGKKVETDNLQRGYGAYYVVHSPVDGILRNINYQPALQAYIKETHQYVDKGGRISSFQGSNAAIAVIILQFASSAEMDSIMCDIHRYVEVELE